MVEDIKRVSIIWNYNTVLYDGRNKISYGLAVRDSIGTLRMDFALGKPRAKRAKSIPQVSMLSLMANPWKILYI